MGAELRIPVAFAAARPLAGKPGSAARGAVNLSRGFSRLGTSLVLAWFAFWTWAYVMRPIRSASAPSEMPAFSWAELAIFAPLAIAAAVFGVRWIVAGFRSN